MVKMKQRGSVCLSVFALSASFDKSEAVLIQGCHKFKIKYNKSMRFNSEEV